MAEHRGHTGLVDIGIQGFIFTDGREKIAYMVHVELTLATGIGTGALATILFFLFDQFTSQVIQLVSLTAQSYDAFAAVNCGPSSGLVGHDYPSAMARPSNELIVWIFESQLLVVDKFPIVVIGIFSAERSHAIGQADP